MEDSTGVEFSTPSPENYEGRLAQEQQTRIEKALNRQYMSVLLSPFMVFSYLAVWQAIRLWRGHVDGEWLLLVSLNLVPVLLIFILLLWIELRQRPQAPHMSHVMRELRQGTVTQSEGELVWRNHAYTPVASRRTLFALDTTVRDLLPGHYRFFYLPKTGLLIAAELLNGSIPHHSLLITLAHTQGFSAATLAANRAGETRREQREILDENAVLLSLCVIILLSVGVLVLALLVFTVPFTESSMKNGDGLLLLSLVTMVIAIPLLIALPALGGGRIRRLRSSQVRGNQHVLKVDGIVHKSVRDADYLPISMIEVGGRQFAVKKAAYDVLDESLHYRVYYLPRGNRLLSMEPLASEAAG